MNTSHPKEDDFDWLREELFNLSFVAERAGFALTARDLKFAIRSLEVEMREQSDRGPASFSA
ncbi:hypothetical protein [Tropicimonas sp. S265A]|uniref:hypothetical protein n=1 Tax=Tropicimonas sp. S265A TaxID=3415134 RepID=UPI003C7BE965